MDSIRVALQQALTAAAATSAEQLRENYPTPPATELGYDPLMASGMPLIQASALALNEAESASLSEHGLVISQQQVFPSFAYGYKTICAEDLPVYISADSILEAVHRTFDSLLQMTEEQVLVGELSQLLESMRGHIPGAFDDVQLSADADLYLTIALSLLKGEPQAPQIAENAPLLDELYPLATEANGNSKVQLFGVSRTLDFSQFEPRGHYADSIALRQYFKAMTWLGRVDLRLVETQDDGFQLFYRRQFDAAVALHELMGEAEFGLWQHIDSTIGTYVGEHDSMTPQDLSGLLEALGADSLASTAQLTDAEIIEEIAEGGWGAQRIASRIIIKSTTSPETLPLDRSFLLFGQRYTVDSHTFVNVTFDRVVGRFMPQPLDVAFSALGNNAALPLLAPEFDNQSYVEGLAKTRALVDAHESEYWQGSVYTRWLDALRSLSAGKVSRDVVGVPATEAWEQRILSTQLASWAELRHDTILYVKQSYTAGGLCKFPDAFVAPYPEFYSKLEALAEAISASVQELPASANNLKNQASAWATLFKTVMSNLEKMANNQLSGAPHSADLLAFVNDAVKWDEQSICGGISYENLSGWYLGLYLKEYAGLQYDPVVTDVHTQPTDAGGADVGRILHVGTGQPRLMIVTAETCSGPSAYAGLAFSYGELITEDWERLNDQNWAQRTDSQFPDVPWMSGILAK